MSPEDRIKYVLTKEESQRFIKNLRAEGYEVKLGQTDHLHNPLSPSTTVNQVNTVPEVTATETQPTTEPDTSEPNIIPFPNPIATLLTTPNVARFLTA